MSRETPYWGTSMDTENDRWIRLRQRVAAVRHARKNARLVAERIKGVSWVPVFPREFIPSVLEDILQ